MRTRRLDSPPALAPLYGKAALGLLPGGGDDVPDEALELAGVGIDVERLARYAQVCGFQLRDALPPTYPHVLAFPVALCLMTDRAFPFPLLGLIHVGNRIEQRGAVGIGDVLDFRVWAENLRPHHRGRQLDLVIEASRAGEVAWVGRSTYLRTGDGSGDRPERAEDPFAGARQTAVWRVPGDIGRRYADVSGDRNPIHLHPLSARLFGFPRAIAHGMWSYARALACVDGRIPPRHVSTVEFRAPMRIPGSARLLSRSDERGWALALESLDGEHRHLELAITR